VVLQAGGLRDEEIEDEVSDGVERLIEMELRQYDGFLWYGFWFHGFLIFLMGVLVSVRTRPNTSQVGWLRAAESGGVKGE
jgi:hypothetical protein